MFFYSESPYVSANGGTVNDITVNGKTYRVHTYTTSGNFTIKTGGKVEYLVVGGGGAGGTGYGNPQRNGSGGNAGTMLTGSLSISDGTYSVVVGAGGSGASISAGSNSSVFNLTASGGNAGASTTAVGTGASGGKDGLQSSIKGVATYYAGGGGAAQWNSYPEHFGGLGGGGDGAQPNEYGNNGSPGTANTGGGGGGGYAYWRNGVTSPRSGGDGGSGIVIVRYEIG
jgi:hypothetical protein